MHYLLDITRKQLYQTAATARNHNEVEQQSVQMPSFLEHSAAKTNSIFSLGILISYPFRKIKFALELLPQFVITFFNHNWHSHDSFRRGSRGGEMGEFSPPFFRAPFFLFFFLIPQILK